MLTIIAGECQCTIGMQRTRKKEDGFPRLWKVCLKVFAGACLLYEAWEVTLEQAWMREMT